ncbi:hypothetical protein CDAR_567791 [Caerostris darwini]|uniref:Uncharacterized protein n=1 Tax=Caerostris darwini TaxID=1538125 RepID=A0AAV4RTD9_9ARAC|nr:hypothetical protein CDAR_567791 [Caerostris darwini]
MQSKTSTTLFFPSTKHHLCALSGKSKGFASVTLQYPGTSDPVKQCNFLTLLILLSGYLQKRSFFSATVVAKTEPEIFHSSDHPGCLTKETRPGQGMGGGVGR